MSEKKILVIEDNDLLRENIGEILEMEGYVVDTAENGEVGIEKAKSSIPDLIISDINMPKADGYEVLSALRKLPETKTVPFIFLTVKNSLQDMRSGMNLGANDYLTKPFDMTELLTAVSKRLEMQHEIKSIESEKYNELRNAVGLPITTIIDEPLRNIERMSDLIESEIESLKGSEIVEISKIVGSTATKLRKEINKILYFYRAEALANNTDELNELKKMKTEQAADIIKEISEGIAVDYNRNSDLYLHLENSPIIFPEEFLRFSINEIVENAFKFSARNCPVKVIAENASDQLKITIQDKGIGMKKSNIDDIHPYIVSKDGKNKGDGLNLGLYNVKSLVRLFDGQIQMKSEEGVGTSFSISFPAA